MITFFDKGNNFFEKTFIHEKKILKKKNAVKMAYFSFRQNICVFIYITKNFQQKFLLYYKKPKKYELK